MKFKNVRDFIKKINMDRIIQVSAVFIGTILVATSALAEKEKEVANEANQVVEWNEPWNSYYFHDYRVIKTYEPRFYDSYGYDLYLPIDFVSDKDIAMSVIRGEYGNGEERKKRLEEAGYDYEKIRSLVNEWYDKQESHQYMEPLVESTFVEDGKFVKKSGYSITYLDEFGDKQVSYYNNNGKLLYTTETKENYQNAYPIIDGTFTLSEDGKFIIKSGFCITYLNENGDKQISYYDNNGNLLSTSEDYENYR